MSTHYCSYICYHQYCCSHDFDHDKITPQPKGWLLRLAGRAPLLHGSTLARGQPGNTFDAPTPRSISAYSELSRKWGSLLGCPSLRRPQSPTQNFHVHSALLTVKITAAVVSYLPSQNSSTMRLLLASDPSLPRPAVAFLRP